MADVHGSPADAAQNPQASNAGSAPVPYQGADQSPEPPDYMAELGPDTPAITAPAASPIGPSSAM